MNWLKSTTVLSSLFLASCSGFPGVDVSAVSWYADQGDATPSAKNYETGKKYLGNGQLGLAIEAFRKDLMISGETVSTLNGLGISYDQLGRFDIATDYYKRALVLDPKSFATANNLSRSLLLQGRAQEALIFAEKAHDLAAAQDGTRNKSTASIAENKNIAQTMSDDALRDQAASRTGMNGSSQEKIDIQKTEQISKKEWRLELNPIPEASDSDAAPVPLIDSHLGVTSTSGIVHNTPPRSRPANPAPSFNVATMTGQRIQRVEGPAINPAPVPQVTAATPLAAVTAPSQVIIPLRPAEPVQIATTVTHANVTLQIAPRDPVVMPMPISDFVALTPVAIPYEQILTAQSTETVVHEPTVQIAFAAVEPRRATVVQPRALRARYRVAHGTGRPLMAKRVAGYMGNQGLQVASLANARHFRHEKSVIRYRKGQEAAARAMASRLPVEVALVENDRTRADVELILGADLLEFDAGLFYS